MNKPTLAELRKRDHTIPWIERVKEAGYKYPLKAPRHSTPQQYHKRYQRKLRRQNDRILDKKIQQDGPSDSFRFRVARVRIGTDEDWVYRVAAPLAEPIKYSYRDAYLTRESWRGFEDDGRVEIHLRGPDDFQLVVKVTPDGVVEPLATERELIPDHVWREVQERADKYVDMKSDYRRLNMNKAYSVPLYGPSPEGMEMAMQLQSEYGLKADNLEVPEEDKPHA